MNHYNTLGVPRDASPEDIKRAYRRKARAHHPDKGGEPAAMAAVNRAYEILSVPEHRRAYDETGAEPQLQTREEKVQAVLMSVFAALIEQDVTNNLLDVCKEAMAGKIRELRSSYVSLKRLRDRLEKQRSLIKRESGPNVFQMVIDHKLDFVKRQSAGCHDELELVVAAKAELDRYESLEEVPVAMVAYPLNGFFGNSTTTSGL